MDGNFGKSLILIGLIIVAVGLFVSAFSKAGSLPKLPGDIYIKKDNFVFYFPWVSSLVISAILSLIFYLFFRR